MRTVSHTLARQHRCCAALFYSGDSLRFPAYNGNEMPSWYTIIFFAYGRVVYKPRCLPLFFLCGLLRQFARGRGTISPQCPGTPRVKPHEKGRLFSDRGQSLFYGLRFSAETLFSVRGFVRLRGRGRGFSLWWYPHHGTGKKSGFPGLCQPVAHTWEPKPNPAVFRFKICGFPRVAATTRGFSAGRTWRNFSPPCGAN